MPKATGTPGQPAAARAGLWEGPHVRYLAIAYAFSWVFWVGAWLVGRALGTGDLLFNEDLVWRVLFERDVPSELLAVSVLSLVGVYGPMLGGVLMSRADPRIPAGDLGRRLRRVRVGWGTYATVAAILLLVTIPTFALTAATTQRTTGAPSAGSLALFLLAFFVVQLLTSGTEEIGWRGYLTEKMLPGRGFWDTGWAVGFVWALWHLPVVVMIFAQQGMEPAQIAASLAGFGLGIIAMAILQAWFYERTRSVFLSVVIHAAFNTLPLTIVLLYEGSPAAVVGNLLLWAFVVVLKSRTDRAARAAAQA